MSENMIMLLVGFIGSGGLIGGFIALRKVKPEIVSLSVNAAEGAVVVQTKVISTLEREIERQSREIVRLQGAEQACLDRLQEFTTIVARIDERQAERRRRELEKLDD